METNEIKINDKVAYNTSQNYFSACFIHFSKVQRKTKTNQLILENGMKFNNKGYQIRSKNNEFPTAYLISVESANNVLRSDSEKNRDNHIESDLVELLKKSKPYTEKQVYKIREFIKIF